MAITRRSALAAALVGGVPTSSLLAQSPQWTPLFDGKSLQGWKETPFRGRGQVQIKDNSILLGTGHLTGITYDREFPKSNYEIRFEAARLDGSDFFAGITFPVKESFCSWINGGWGGAVVGLSSIDGDDASENETSQVRDFVKGRWYAFRLAVTEDHIRCWIDNQLIIDADIKGREINLRPGEIDLSTPLGFAAYSTLAGLRNIQYRRLSPEGK